ncbi:carboxylating nicotinate-nucleotide diphosphorylase [Candidatus Woesearchaeota archaeon]|nr:carboxylating nicotinate-nucleotide diphosphorylase [Candidatus Woesearchaeota archaeon]
MEQLPKLIRLALAEDIGKGDLTSILLLPKNARGVAQLTAKEAGVIAGLATAAEVFWQVDASLSVKLLVHDGDQVKKGTVLATIKGRVRPILAAERTALNILQHLSGIATYTWGYVKELAGTGVVLLDTRKTLPGMRRLEKYATLVGGAKNHRMGLYDSVLIKSNHLTAVGSIREALLRARGSSKRIEIEVKTLAQFKEALQVGASVIMLDNMNLLILKKAVALRNSFFPDAKLEASGGIRLSNIRDVAKTGVDYISCGAITHSAPALDINLQLKSVSFK